MRSLKRLIKGILISLMLVMLLNTGLRLGVGLNDFLGSDLAYAQDSGFGGVCDPLPDNPNYDQAACDALGESESVDSGGGSNEDPAASLPDEEAPQTPADIQKVIDGVANLAHFSHRIFAPLINFLSFQIGNLLGNDYLYHGDLGSMIHKLWVISRNLVNIVFVFLLLMLALKTIFSPNFAIDDLKKKLIIFALVLVSVNFSWLGTKVVLDAANVVTHVVFAIPSGIGTDTSLPQCQINDEHTGFTGACAPTAIYGPVTSNNTPYYYEGDDCERVKADFADGYDLETGERNDQATGGAKKVQGKTIFCMENLNLIKYNQNTAVIYMTYGMTRIQNLVYSTKNAGFDGLTVGVLMSFLLQLVYVISLVALFIALIVRMVMLWVFVGFSPFLVLMLYFKGDDKNPLEQLSGKFDIDTFFKWAFVPAKVGAVFVISFAMITTGQSIGEYKLTLFDNLNEKAGIVNKILEPQSLFAGAGSLQSFIWLLMSVVIMWLGVFAVLQDMPIVGAITQKIKGYGDSLAGLVATLPYKAPILPLGKEGEPKSVKELLGPLDMRGKIADYVGPKAGSAEDIRRFESVADNRSVADALRKLSSATGTNKRKEAETIAKSYGFRNLEHMMQINADTLRAGFRRSNTHEGKNDQELYDALSRALKQPKSAAELATEAQQQERIIERANEAAATKQSPPGTAPAPQTPVAPPAQKPSTKDNG